MAKDRITGFLRELPDDDRESIERAFESKVVDHEDDDLDDPSGLAAHWGVDTRIANVTGYVYWIRFLKRSQKLDPNQAPGARASREHIKAYHQDLARVSPVSRLSYLSRARNVLQVIDRKGDYRYLSKTIRTLKRRAKPSRDQRHLLVAPSDMFFAGLNRMKRELPKAETNFLSASRFEDGLIMSVLICKALRRKNFASMVIGENIARNARGAYEVKFAPLDTKARRRICAELSKMLTPFIDLWLKSIREVLLGGRSSDAFWITKRHTAMSSSAFYQRFCRVTYDELRLRLNPHFVRKIVATGVAVGMPDFVRMVGTLLDQTSDQSEAYNLADQLSASELHLKFLDDRRRQALVRSRRK